jgi:uncharacterized protein (DUF305 family)
MKTTSSRTMAAALLAVVVLASCSTATGESGPRTVQPGAPGDSGRVPTAEQTTAPRQPRYTEADVRFMQGMIVHHRQALEMTDLVPARSSHEDVRLLAEIIETSQAQEILRMKDWLEDRGKEIPPPGAGHHHHMPGMASPREMARLAAATGTEFDRLFLELMIQHHQGALVMVDELFDSPGAVQEPETYEFASHVAGGQKVEIARMRRMLDDLQ